jgi:MFS family permease
MDSNLVNRSNAMVRVNVAISHPRTLLFLLTLGMCINFFDRVSLSVSAPVWAPELHITTWSLGLLLSSFFWTYSVCQIGSGWLVDRVEARSAYAVAFTLWSIATLCMAFASSFKGLLSMLLVLGVCESLAYPMTSHIIASAFPEERRGLANSLVDLGARLGPAAGTVGGGLLIAHVGWRGLLIICGIGGGLWVVPWLLLAPRLPVSHGKSTDAVVSWRRLLSKQAVWGTFGGISGANYAWYFLLTWLPSYLMRERHFSLASLAAFGSLPYLFMAISSVSGGALSDYLIKRGHAPIFVRKVFLSVGLCAMAFLLPFVLLPQTALSLAGLYSSCFGFGIYASNLFSLTQALAGTQAAGRWTGAQNCCGNAVGIASGICTGWLVQHTGSFATPFIAASCACLLGAASFWLLVREKRTEIFRVEVTPQVQY